MITIRPLLCSPLNRAVNKHLMPTRTPLACTLAALAGMGFWFWASLASGRREPWDDASCWSVACPAAVVLAGILGYLFPACPWRWALTLFLAQFAAMCIHNGELGNLWPLGLALFAVLSLPAVALAQGGAWLRRGS